MTTKALEYNHQACKELLHFGLLKVFTFLRAYLLNNCMSDSNEYIHLHTNSRIKTSKLKERRKNETLMDSNPHLLSAKDSLLSIKAFENCIFFSFIKIIVAQSKAHILRRFPKIRRKVIEYLYVSGQCRQTIFILVFMVLRCSTEPSY